MISSRPLIGALMLFGALPSACTCGSMPPANPDGSTAGGESGSAGGTGTGGGGTGGGTMGGGTGGSSTGGAGGGFGVLPDGGWGTLADGGCAVSMCASQNYQCGNCRDDDGDGLVDSRDPDCLGPCHNNERGFATGIPSFGATSCNRLDCYYDTNQGFGEGCRYTHSCDPLTPSGSACTYNPNLGNACTTSQMCRDYCNAYTPLGCDCYGCCTAFLPDGGSRDIYLGSDLVNGGRQCTIATVGDPAVCKACTKAVDCGKGACGTCQLCLGRTTLPPECFPQPVLDGGTTLPDGGARPDGGLGTLPDGGSLARCPPLVEPCGLPGDAPCPLGGFCQTGCCILIQ